MSYEDNAGLSVFNQYGPRFTQDGVVSGGKNRTAGAINDAVVYIRGEDFDGGTSFNTRLTLPEGATFIEAIAEVTEAFALGGTSPTIAVGTDTSEPTNNAIELTEAQGEATGTYYNATGAGTWASPLTADTEVGVSLGGSSPTVTDAGEAKVIIRYLKI